MEPLQKPQEHLQRDQHTLEPPWEATRGRVKVMVIPHSGERDGITGEVSELRPQKRDPLCHRTTPSRLRLVCLQQ